jgi:hypothetical protein
VKPSTPEGPDHVNVLLLFRRIHGWCQRGHLKWGNHDGLQGVKDPWGAGWCTATRKRGLRCGPPSLGGPDQANIVVIITWMVSAGLMFKRYAWRTVQPRRLGAYPSNHVDMLAARSCSDPDRDSRSSEHQLSGGKPQVYEMPLLTCDLKYNWIPRQSARAFFSPPNFRKRSNQMPLIQTSISHSSNQT